jgi:hypothetical protein
VAVFFKFQYLPFLAIPFPFATAPIAGVIHRQWILGSGRVGAREICNFQLRICNNLDAEGFQPHIDINKLNSKSEIRN